MQSMSTQNVLMPTFCRPVVVGHDKSTTNDQIKNTEIEILTVSFTEIKISDEMILNRIVMYNVII
ncbi:hypothetical protein T12_10581 [Trichinella patagoniensis]|uniref:Uncharacterized protein n=1 Tax=Trichinella patagoniensis TaxID=990121 RepID=A0A0V1A5T3_9BILA|nr:hypothetical protein T12_10581 [Trichinella patagoniensis]